LGKSFSVRSVFLGLTIGRDVVQLFDVIIHLDIIAGQEHTIGVLALIANKSRMESPVLIFLPGSCRSSPMLAAALLSHHSEMGESRRLAGGGLIRGGIPPRYRLTIA
jgi:hypothetical protein